jgi:chaperone modulatory protein CbpM
MFTEDELCVLLRIEPASLRLWLDEGWLAPCSQEAGVLLSEMDLARAQLIRDLRDDIGVNNEGIGVILSLLDQLHGTRAVLQTLLANFGSAERSDGA